MSIIEIKFIVCKTIPNTFYMVFYKLTLNILFDEHANSWNYAYLKIKCRNAFKFKANNRNMSKLLFTYYYAGYFPDCIRQNFLLSRKLVIYFFLNSLIRNSKQLNN